MEMDDPKKYVMIIGMVVAIGVIVIVGISLVDSMGTASDVSNTETFEVNDPNTDKTCSLEYDAVDSSMVVQYYNGTTWTTLTAADYTLSGSTLTVKSSAMD